MTGAKPTRQQVVEALEELFFHDCLRIADTLVAKGLAEEPLEPGLYCVKRFDNSGWQFADWSGRSWHLLEATPMLGVVEPAVVHRQRILPPCD
jgi:hypothetical protein